MHRDLFKFSAALHKWSRSLIGESGIVSFDSGVYQHSNYGEEAGRLADFYQISETKGGVTEDSIVSFFEKLSEQLFDDNRSYFFEGIEEDTDYENGRHFYVSWGS